MRGGANEVLTLKGTSVSDDGLTDRSIDCVLLPQAGRDLAGCDEDCPKKTNQRKKPPPEKQTKQTKQTKPQSHGVGGKNVDQWRLSSHDTAQSGNASLEFPVCITENHDLDRENRIEDSLTG